MILASSGAYAGAWTQGQGQGVAIVTANYGSSDHLWDNAGTKRRQPDYDKATLNPYIEYGYADGTTIGGSAQLVRVHQDAQLGIAENTRYGLGDTEIFVRQRIIDFGGLVFSVQPMIKLPSPDNSNASPKIGSDNLDAGIAGLAGFGFDMFGYHHFADMGMEYRHRFGDPKDQVRTSATLGIGVADSWTIMPQLFITHRTNSPNVPVFTQSPEDDFNLTQLQLSAVYKYNSDFSFQFGGYSSIDGKNAGEMDGALFSVWTNF